MAVNFFCLIWNNNYFYDLPLFSLGPVLAKVNRDMTEAVIVVPDDQPRAIIFSAISKKYDSSRQTLQ